MTKKQHYMTKPERYKLEALHRAGMPVAQIAQQLGFCRQTIYNEIRQGLYPHETDFGPEMRYSADKAQQIHDYNQTAKGRPVKIGKEHAYAQFLENKMLGVQPNGKIDKRKRLSPAAALAQARKEEDFSLSICVTTLYSYIEHGIFLRVTNKNLWEKSKKKRSYEPVQRIAHPKLPSIEDRPEYINSREEPGHCEMDLVVSGNNEKSALLTLTERTGHFEFIRKIPDKRAATVRTTLADIRQKLPPGMVIRSITTDNGPEFLEYEKLIETIFCPVYYCHSYAAWEKGTNENHNRMIRRWFPKRTNFGKISAEEINECQDWMNNYPRKSLGWLTPNEFMTLTTA